MDAHQDALRTLTAPAAFQRVVTAALMARGAHGFCRVYIDDIVVFSHTMEDHICHVDIVLTILSGVQLKAHPGKSIFGCRGKEYLGHYISSDGLSPAEAKTQASDSCALQPIEMR